MLDTDGHVSLLTTRHEKWRLRLTGAVVGTRILTRAVRLGQGVGVLPEG
jgi:hypothetical protein